MAAPDKSFTTLLPLGASLDEHKVACTHSLLTKDSKWYAASCAVYFVICLFDFIVVPSWIGLNRESFVDLLPLVEGLEASVANTVVARPQWQPLTLQGGGLFHLAFGAIITGTSVYRNKNTMSF